jgi:hypothetical protein
MEIQNGNTANIAMITADDSYGESWVRWETLEVVPASAACDGCKLTVRGLHADAVDAARTMPQSSWKALDEMRREEVVRIVWHEFTCARFVNVTALRRDTAGRLVDLLADTRDSEITNPTETRAGSTLSDGVSDRVSAKVLANVCELLRDDAQSSDWLASAIADFYEIRPMSDAAARSACDKLSEDAACTVGEHDEL